MRYIIVVPAYGRDYQSEHQAIEAWKSGKDFRINDISSRWDGAYCSIRDELNVKIRYNRLQDVVFYPPMEG